MLSGKEILTKFKSIIPKRRAVIISTAILIGLHSIIPKNAHAVSKNTYNKFMQTYTYIEQVMEDNKKVSQQGNIQYVIPGKEQAKINSLMDKAMKDLEKDVKDDIKNENWGQCQKDLEILASTAHAFGQLNYEKEIWRLIQEVHGDFTNHINTNIEGVYTLKGSGKVYCIGKGRGRMVGMARTVADTRARNQLLIYLKINNAQITLSRPITYQHNKDGTIGSVVEFQGEVRYNGTKITAKELAKKLEQDKRFLPLK